LDLGGSQGANGERRSKAKYMKLLRKVANRQTAEVIVDLADLKKVCIR
jgi:DNA replication licensing factor MCM7